MAKKEKKGNKKTAAGYSWDTVKNLVYAVIAALIIKTFFIETSRVPTGSMENTIMVGDFLFVNKYIYGMSSPRNIPFTNVKLPYFQLPAFRDPERGDIVVFEYPGNRDDLFSETVDNYVKRCIGLPGDTVQIVDKVVFVNGEEAWRPPDIQYRNTQIKPSGIPEIGGVFPNGERWNGDNYGPLYIPKEGDTLHLTLENVNKWRTIIDREHEARVVEVRGGIIYINGNRTSKYVLEQDYYFMMGDNRDNSLDSRYWGFVPQEKIVGLAIMVYWSWDPDIPFYNLFKLLGSVRLNRIAKLVY